MIAVPSRLSFALLLVLASSAACALPIDCSKARTTNERALCGDPFLLQTDARLDTLYDVSLRMVGMGERSALVDSQRAWIRERESCGADKNCMRAAYARREAVFAAILKRVEEHGPF